MKSKSATLLADTLLELTNRVIEFGNKSASAKFEKEYAEREIRSLKEDKAKLQSLHKRYEDELTNYKEWLSKSNSKNIDLKARLGLVAKFIEEKKPKVLMSKSFLKAIKEALNG